MARGFESKDVEFQQTEAVRVPTTASSLSAAERDAREHRRSVELSLSRMRSELERATVPAHRRGIEAAIRALDVELTQLS